MKSQYLREKRDQRTLELKGMMEIVLEAEMCPLTLHRLESSPPGASEGDYIWK